MEEAFSRPVAHGYQFYAGTRERVEVRFDDALRTKTRDAIARCRDLSARDTLARSSFQARFFGLGMTRLLRTTGRRGNLSRT